jgi:hypothetical protein
MAIYILKYLKEKEELWKLKYFQKKLLKSSKKDQNPLNYNSITNIKFQHLSQIIIFQKSSHKNRHIT